MTMEFGFITDSSSDSDMEEGFSEQEKQEAKRKKAFKVAEEIMTSERTFIDILKLLNIVSMVSLFHSIFLIVR